MTKWYTAAKDICMMGCSFYRIKRFFFPSDLLELFKVKVGFLILEETKFGFNSVFLALESKKVACIYIDSSLWRLR